MIKVYPLFFLLFALPIFMSAQPRWEVGFNIGGNNYVGDLTTSWGPVIRETQFGYGLFCKRHLNQSIGIRLNYQGGSISGDDTRSDERAERGMNFSTQINEASLLFEWQFNAKSRYTKGAVHSIATPYLFAGPGVTFFKPTTDYNEDNDNNAFFDPRDLESQKGMQVLSLNTGAGIRFDLSERSSLGFEASLHPAFTDWLDGVKYSGNPDANDWFMFYGMTFAYRLDMMDKDKDGITDALDVCPDHAGDEKFFGCPDTDKDGIRDALDVCPELPGSAFFRGCPDTDGDGTTDNIDQCPDVPGPGALYGCPDQDEDGLADNIDDCPDIPGLRALKGCPDSDADGITDALDVCPTIFGLTAFKGCPDTDGDGIPDSEDTCPTMAGLASDKGCPFLDNDGDGVTNPDDLCPDLKGTMANKGCPDTDGDGVHDLDDRCPYVRGLAGNKGCPELKKEDRDVIALAERSVQFEFGSDRLTAYSQSVLDKVSTVLKKYPEQNVFVSGHTDSKGSDAFNLKLSERRAQRCRQYLIDKGISAGRLTAKGYGEAKPIATNATTQGQAKNRRVEFELSLR
ncbi:MAG: OmpA family protein [Saprospiraceae bacterium]|nr:OmpA family protein [Saprospiraceae bacterium]